MCDELGKHVGQAGHLLGVVLVGLRHAREMLLPAMGPLSHSLRWLRKFRRVAPEGCNLPPSLWALRDIKPVGCLEQLPDAVGRYLERCGNFVHLQRALAYQGLERASCMA